MASLRELANKTGITRDTDETTRLYAEDWNEVKDKINDGTDSVNTASINIAGDETISSDRTGIFANVENDSGAVVKFTIKGIITEETTTFATIDTLPASAVLWNIYFYVSEAFTGGEVDIGTSGENDRYATLTTELTTTGWKTVSLTNIPDRITSSTAIGGIFSGSSTTGSLEVYFEYAMY